MNDPELDRALDAIHRGRTHLSDPPELHERALAVPLHTTRRRRWLPRIDTGRFQSMFSAAKFVLAAVIVALFGGFLLTGVLTQQEEEPLPVGASVSASPQVSPVATDVIEVDWSRGKAGS